MSHCHRRLQPTSCSLSHGHWDTSIAIWPQCSRCSGSWQVTQRLRRRDDQVLRAGPPGNERLTTSVGLVLLVLLVAETLTTLSARSLLPVHLFLGLLVLPSLALKLGSTGWRF